MQISVNNAAVHLGTGGQEFNSDLPTVLFLHGSGMDHRAWALQARWFAFNGYGVLAPDFPAHSLSAGEPLESIEQSADWLLQVLDTVGVSRVHIVGHSQGFLSGIELAKRSPDSVLSLTGIGTAAAIPVNPSLIDTAKKSAAQAANMMMNWGCGASFHMGASPIPGMQPIAVGRAIMSNNPLASDLEACADYQGGDEAALSVANNNIPCAMILAGQDKMTPLKSGKACAHAMQAQVTVMPEYGHMLPLEAPAQVLSTLKQFISNIH